MTAEEFELANKAFDMFTLAEREAALHEFASLRYPSINARFHEAVYRVVRKIQGGCADEAPPGSSK